MNQEDIAKMRYLIENDRQHYKAYIGVQFLLDGFERTLNALVKSQEENEQWRVDFMALKAKLEEAEREAGWH
jgi:hypothetical protein